MKVSYVNEQEKAIRSAQKKWKVSKIQKLNRLIKWSSI